MNSMDTPHPTLFSFFFLSLTILLYLFSHSWLGTGMCTSSHVMARRRSPLSLPCGTNDNQRILTNLIVCDRRRLSPIPASLLNIKSQLHAPRFVCKEVVVLFFLNCIRMCVRRPLRRLCSGFSACGRGSEGRGSRGRAGFAGRHEPMRW